MSNSSEFDNIEKSYNEQLKAFDDINSSVEQKHIELEIQKSEENKSRSKFIIGSIAAVAVAGILYGICVYLDLGGSKEKQIKEYEAQVEKLINDSKVKDADIAIKENQIRNLLRDGKLSKDQIKTLENQLEALNKKRFDNGTAVTMGASAPYSNGANNTNITVIRQGRITGNDVIIRSAPTTNSSVIGYLNKNDNVTILDTAANNDKTSAVFSRDMYLSYKGQQITLNKGLAIKVQRDDGRQVTGQIKLKDGWQTVTTPKNSITYISSSTWYHIKADNKSGYVYGNYVNEF